MLKYNLFLLNNYWLLQSILFSFMCPEMVSEGTHSKIFSKTTVRLNGLWFPRSFFLPFFKGGCSNCFLQPLGLSSSVRDFSKLIGNTLSMIKERSLITFRCILSGSVDLYWSGFLKRFLIQASSITCGSSLPWTLSLGIKARRPCQWISGQKRHWLPHDYFGASCICLLLNGLIHQ